MAGSAPAREDITASETGLMIAEEAIPGVLDDAPAWFEHDPNTYNDFGAKLKLVARSPISSDRSQKKGTIVGLSVAGGFTEDLTMGNMQETMQGFMFADLRRKSEFPVAEFAADGIVLANGGTAFVIGTIFAVKGSTINSNNGMHVATAAGQAAKIPGVFSAITGQSAVVSRVGFQGAAGDLQIDVTGPLPVLTSTTVDFTTWGLTPGEWVWIGGDTSTTRLPDATNTTGWGRVLSIAPHAIVFDKTDAVWVAGSGAAKTLQVFFGRVLKNEKRDLIKYRTYSMRRLLGAPDLEDPNRVQSEILLGATPGKIGFNFKEEDKITLDLTFMARKYRAVPNDADIPGTIYGVVEEDAVNTAGDTVRARMAVYPELSNSSAPVPLFAVFENFNLDIDNNLEENKGVGRLGSFSISPGNFMVSGKFTAYFVDVASTDAIAQSSDVTFDFMAVKNNRGFAMDLPLVALGSDGAKVEPNKSVRIDLDVQAATGVKYHPDLAHTLLLVFFDYLPDIASTSVS